MLKICAAVASNYLPYARALAASLHAHHPDVRPVLLLLDDTDPPCVGLEAFDVVRPPDLLSDSAELRHMRAMYGVVELIGALKPLLLRRLLDAGATAAMYVDADIFLFAPLDEVADLAREHDIVVTPHTTRPIPRDGKRPDEKDILDAGMFNLGFIAVGDGGRVFLDWWEERVRRDSMISISEGLYADQRWVDFVPSYFRYFILRDPAYNVAFWNLDQRRVDSIDSRYEVDGQPLRFFHFAGFDPARPAAISRHLDSLPQRVDLSEYPTLTRLFREYADSVIQEGYSQAIKSQYRYGVTAGGFPLDRRMRRLYRYALLAAERDGGELPPDPFDPRQAEAFVTWLRSPAPREIPVSRYLQAVYDESVDLDKDLAGPNVARFLDWVRVDGRADPPIPPELIPPDGSG